MTEGLNSEDTAARQQRAMALLWGTEQRPSRGPKPSLTLEGVVAAAIGIADAEGLGAVSMQRLAADLGVTKMAVYRYVPGKPELTMLMTDIAMGLPPEPEPAGDWRARFESLGRALWDGFAAHPWVVGATVGLRPMGPCELAWADAGAAALAGVGLSGAERLDAMVLLTGFMRSLAQQTLPVSPAAIVGSEAEVQAQIMATLTGQPDRFPALREAIMDGSSGAGTGDALEFGLARILDGIAVLIEQRAA